MIDDELTTRVFCREGGVYVDTNTLDVLGDGTALGDLTLALRLELRCNGRVIGSGRGWWRREMIPGSQRSVVVPARDVIQIHGVEHEAIERARTGADDLVVRVTGDVGTWLRDDRRNGFWVMEAADIDVAKP